MAIINLFSALLVCHKILELQAHFSLESNVAGCSNHPSCGKNLPKNLMYEENINLKVTLNETMDTLPHFWRSTGFCPPDPHSEDWYWFSSESMRQNLAYIGALPHDGIKQVRVHWLLDALTIDRLKRNKPVYNFTKLDLFIDMMNKSGLRPGFELMGNPGGLFNDFTNATQIVMWKDLIYQLAKHYIDKYGIDEISTWNFETWNEPKQGHFGSLNMTRAGFMNYYDASWAGLRMASNKLRYGGPGGECKKFSLKHYCWAFLDHVHNGKDYFTGRKPLKPSFISIHKKGEYPENTAWILKKEAATLRDINLHFPNLSDIPIYNDEGDPLVGWSKGEDWRADATYAAMVVKIIIAHQRTYIRDKYGGVKLALLSNDNGFLSYSPRTFTQRTLLARFQINSTDPPHVQMITKPVFNIMGLLAFLGNKELRAVSTEGKNLNDEKLRSYTGYLATYRAADIASRRISDEWSVILYHSSDTLKISGEARFKLTFDGLSSNSREILLVVYKIDNAHGNPYLIWRKMGCPAAPSKKEIYQMRKKQDPARVIGPSTFNAAMEVAITVPNPGVALVQICAKPDKPPSAVGRVRLHQIAKEQVLVTWYTSPIASRCISTYIVLFSKLPSGKYHRINRGPTIFNFYVYAASNNGTLSGYFKVRAVDLWNRKGHPSRAAYLQ